MAELDRLDRVHGLGTMPAHGPRPPRSRRDRAGRTGRGSTVLATLVAAAVVCGYFAVSPNDELHTLRRLVGLDDRPLAAPEIVASGGSFSFMHTQRRSSEPVGYSPCLPVEVLVNPEGAPPRHDSLVDTGLATVQESSGLEFVRVGETTDRDVDQRPSSRRPVLIMWATPDEVPELSGRVAGIGGSVAVQRNGGRLEYLTGRVVLDRDLFATLAGDRQHEAQAILDHELGHLVGLGHVDDPGELMHDDNVGRTTFGAGDLEGLARLGNIAC